MQSLALDEQPLEPKRKQLTPPFGTGQDERVVKFLTIEYGRSPQQHIYFAGDVTGPPMIANKATAQVGRLTGDSVKTSRVSYSASMKAHLLPEGDGFVKLAYDENDGRILGAVAVGPHAADVIAPVAVAIRAGMAVGEFGVLYGAHPTFSELAFTAAR